MEGEEAPRAPAAPCEAQRRSGAAAGEEAVDCNGLPAGVQNGDARCWQTARVGAARGCRSAPESARDKNTSAGLEGNQSAVNDFVKDPLDTSV